MSMSSTLSNPHSKRARDKAAGEFREFIKEQMGLRRAEATKSPEPDPGLDRILSASTRLNDLAREEHWPAEFIEEGRAQLRLQEEKALIPWLAARGMPTTSTAFQKWQRSRHIREQEEEGARRAAAAQSLRNFLAATFNTSTGEN